MSRFPNIDQLDSDQWRHRVQILAGDLRGAIVSILGHITRIPSSGASSDDGLLWMEARCVDGTHL